MLWLSTLGRFALFDGVPENGGVRQLGPSKPLALLAYLALAPKGRASRDQLLGLLWNDREAERARATLRQTLWALRQQFGEEIVQTDGDAIVLGVSIQVDSRLFDEAVARDDMDAAWQLYRGAFVPDFAAPGCAEFEQWADIRRTRMATAWENVGRRRISLALEAGAPGTAADLAAILRDASPLEWDFWRLRLESLLLLGDQHTARVEADALQEQLRLSGERPPAALRALLTRLERRTSAVSTETSAPWRSELVGREAALATLVRAWVPVSQGRGTVCTVRGSAGMGKSRLLRAFA
jgi:DNA-binding SARP family transcriptional activator